MDGAKTAATRCSRHRGRVFLSLSAYARIKAHSILTYPHECCGLLIGRKTDAATWGVVKAFPARNAHRERKSDRYEIEPHAILTAINGARAQGMEWIGVYHSHPNGLPTPSSTDSEMAWEGLIYLIVGVSDGEVATIRAWLYVGEMTNELVNGFAKLEVVTLEDALIHIGTFANGEKVDVQIDLRGEVLPFSIIRAKDELEQMRAGQIVSIIFDCERSLKQLPEALEDSGHYVICVRLHEEHQWEAIVKRGYKPPHK